MVYRSIIKSTLVALVLAVYSLPASAQSSVTPAEARAIAKDAYIYGFPVVDSYRVQHAYFVDRDNPEFKAPWNQIRNIPPCLHARRQGDPDPQLGHALFLPRHGPAG